MLSSSSSSLCAVFHRKAEGVRMMPPQVVPPMPASAAGVPFRIDSSAFRLLGPM